MENYQKVDSNGESFSVPVDGIGLGVEVLTTSQTLTVEQSGKILKVATDALTFTLPATIEKCKFIIENTGTDAAVGITISPNASDKIYGKAFNGLGLTVMTGTDNKDIVNTKATAKKGDLIVLEGDGVDGWNLVQIKGVWTEESTSFDLGILNITDNTTLTVHDHNKLITVGVDAKVITLPATVKGLRYRFSNIGADGNNIITISPAAADGIAGIITLASSVVALDGTVNKDVINTKATSKLGNSLTIVGTGTSGTSAWVVESSTGIWARES
jgi:hypothetical protein